MNKRLPKATEVDELLENCIWTLEGNGHRVTGPSGNSIFLPMDGAIMEDGIGEVSKGGYYWALNTESSEPGHASCYYVDESPYSRDFGSWPITDKLSVRMVGDSGIDLGLSVRWMPYNEERNSNKLFTHKEACLLQTIPVVSGRVQYVKEVFDKFLKDNKVYDAWYERYRLSNAMHNDEIPIEDFILNMIRKGSRGFHNIFYSGIQGTCMTSKEGDAFIAKNKQCDILSNGDMSDANEKWMDTWKSLISLEKLNND